MLADRADPVRQWYGSPRDGRLGGMLETRSSLVRLHGDCFGIGTGILEQYSSLKLGCVASADYYAKKMLLPIAEIVNASPKRRWIITGPPMTGVPAAANLLSCRIDRMRRSETKSDIRVRLRNIRKDVDADWLSGNHYAQLSYSKRKRRLRDSLELWHRPAWLSGASLIVVNDVCVMGAHEAELKNFFCDLGVMDVHWQYIAEFDLKNQVRASLLETCINDFSLPGANEFVAFLSRTQVLVPTTKFFWRLFSLRTGDFRRAVNALPRRKRMNIYKVIERCGGIRTPALKQKMKILETHASNVLD